MSKYIFVNCEKLNIERTLGVAHFLIELCKELKNYYKIIFVINSQNEIENNQSGQIVKEIAEDIIIAGDKYSDFNVINYIPSSSRAVELLPHHFQPPRFNLPSVLICHDLHVFDIEWKYNNAENVKNEFRKNLLSANAVVCEFPRTFYDIEHIADITLQNLYLTESPLLINTAINCSKNIEKADLKITNILFPAQMQRHKNHEALIQGLNECRKEGIAANLLFPGSSFDANYKTKLIDLIKELNLTSSVEFLGRITNKEIIDLYHMCDGVIIPSLAEGGAYVAFEAIAAGKPVAVNSIKSAMQHIKMIKGKVHWFDSTDIVDTAAAIKFIVTQKEEDFFSINKDGRERIQAMTWKVVSEKFAQIISWLLGDRDRPIMKIDSDGWNIKYS